MKSVDEIIALYRERKTAHGPLLAKAAELTETYNGDLVVPLPEMDKNEKVAVANLVQLGLDQYGARVASTVPDVFYPPEREGIKDSQRRADIRRQATLGWWDGSQYDVVLGRRSRQLLGYAATPMRIRWSAEKEMPVYRVASPLSTFPAHTENPNDVDVPDVVFLYMRSLSWLKRNYPEATARLEKGENPSGDLKFEVIEYVDGEESVLAVIGRQRVESGIGNPDLWLPVHMRGMASRAGEPFVELERLPNRIGVCPAVVAGRITLDRPIGRYDGLIGLFQAQAKFMALETIAVAEGVWPKTWLVARQGEVPEVIVEADPKHGVTGMVKGGEIQMTQLQPGYKTTETVDRLYQAMMVEGGIASDMTGQSGTNIRTGRRGDSILSAVVDYPIQEAQRLLERSIQAENRIAMATAKEYGSGKRSFYVNWKGAKGRVDYDPARDFTDFTNFVSYPHAGADINQLVVGLGQRLATKLISRTSARRLDPMVDDPDFEERRTTAEGLSDALLTAIQGDVTKGQYGAVEVARMMAYLDENPDSTLAEAVEDVQRQMQERQAGQLPPEAPEAQPGLAAGAGGPGGMANPGQIAPTPNESGLAALLSSLHGPAQMAQAGAGQ